MEMRHNTSPNFDSRCGQNVDMLVLHYTGMKSAEAALSRLCDETAKVSAHYMVDKDGKIFHLVDENERAWHAGVSYWRGNTNINQRSIGIEIVNSGHEFGYQPFPEAQMEAVAELCWGIITRHKIPARNVVGHSDVAPTRKQDPGELFDWKLLASKGIGLFPDISSLRGGAADAAIQAGSPRYARDDSKSESALKDYGYDITDPEKAIIAFQRHFRPESLSGIWDDECAKLLAALLEVV